MADNIALIKLEVQVADGELKVDRLKSKLQQLTKGSDDYNLVVKKIQIAENNLSKTRDKLTKSTQGLIGGNKKGLTGVSQAAGASTSATLELGRVLSDMPYGIRGVANNLQQLASNLFFMSKATDGATGKTVGFMGAIKNLLGGLIGPAGILIAFQGIIALFDYFSSGAKKAEKSTKDFRESVGGAAVALKSLKIVVDNNMLSKKELADVVGKVNEKYKDLNIELDKEGQLTKESIKQIDNKILALEDLAKANAMMSVIEEKHTEIIRAQLKLQEDTSKRLEDIGAKDLEDFKQNKDELTKVQEGYYKGAIDADKLATKARIQGSIDTFNKEKSKIESEIKELLKLSTDSGFFDDFFNGKKKSKEKLDEVKALFDLDMIDPDKDVREMQAYLEEISGILGGELDPLSIAPKLDFKLSDETLRAGDAYKKDVLDTLIQKIKLEEYDEYAKQLQKVLGSINDFLDSEFERQLTMEQNKTNVLNNELHQRLLNEKLSKDERKAIQNEIAQNDENLRIKQQAIEKKKFKQQKAFNIAMATIDTFRAATGVLAETKGGSFARIAGMVAVISSGLLQVAAISRQKFQSSSASSPIRGGASGAGGGDGVGDRSFNFNLVGNTIGNQITDAIQGQFDKPLKAYVVSRDITSQQALDANIKGTASF